MFSRYRLIKAGNYLEIREYAQEQRYLKLPQSNYDKSNWSNNITDEEKKKNNRERAVFRAKKNLQLLINANAGEWINPETQKPFKSLFLTLTFRENIQDLETTNYEFKKFMQNFNYAAWKKKKNLLKYVVVHERQKRGAIHYHQILFNLPYMERIYDKLKELWNNQRFRINAIDNVENVGAYVAKYMAKDLKEKVPNKKSYFGSKHLFQPKEICNQQIIMAIMEILPKDTLILERPGHNDYQGDYVLKKFDLRKYPEYSKGINDLITPT